MDLLLICKDASAGSLLTNLLWAVQAKKNGQNGAVFFTGEALAALHSGVFLWPRELSEQSIRLTLANNAASFGIPLMGRGEGRQLDAQGFLTSALEAGVLLYACPLWTDLLGLRQKLPAGITALDVPGAQKLVREAKSVVGSF